MWRVPLRVRHARGEVSDGGVCAGRTGQRPDWVYPNGEAFEVEFLALDGHTAALATVLPSQVRPVARTDITHARQISSG